MRAAFMIALSFLILCEWSSSIHAANVTPEQRKLVFDQLKDINKDLVTSKNLYLNGKYQEAEEELLKDYRNRKNRR